MMLITHNMLVVKEDIPAEAHYDQDKQNTNILYEKAFAIYSLSDAL